MVSIASTIHAKPFLALLLQKVIGRFRNFPIAQKLKSCPVWFQKSRQVLLITLLMVV